jgi:acetolactate synthase small subunit
MSDPCPGTLTIIAHDRHGLLARVASVFHRRAVAIHRLTFGPSGEPQRARVVVVADAPPPQLARLQAAIAALVDVVSVELEGAPPDGAAPLG